MRRGCVALCFEALVLTIIPPSSWYQPIESNLAGIVFSLAPADAISIYLYRVYLHKTIPCFIQVDSISALPLPCYHGLALYLIVASLPFPE